MDPTLNADAHPRLAAMRSVRSWRSGQSLLARVMALIVAIAAFLTGCFLVMGSAQARVQIDFDPMRPAVTLSPAAPAASGAAVAEAPSAAPALPTLKITRGVGTGSSAAAGALSALVDDTWVRRGDVVAGYRVTALRTESIDLVSLAEPTLRLTLRLNPVSVERTESTPAHKALSSLTPPALEKRP